MNQVQEKLHIVFTYEDRLLRLESLSANMWTVPLSLDEHRKAESALNVILSIAETQVKQQVNKQVKCTQCIHYIQWYSGSSPGTYQVLWYILRTLVHIRYFDTYHVPWYRSGTLIHHVPWNLSSTLTHTYHVYWNISGTLILITYTGTYQVLWHIYCYLNSTISSLFHLLSHSSIFYSKIFKVNNK